MSGLIVRTKVSDLLLSHGYKIYIATRLYDYSQKLQAEELEKNVLKTLTDVTDIEHFEKPVTFVPFRDIDEDKIISENKSLSIFQKDIERLSKDVIGLIGIYNDISKDDGIAFEIGYSYANSIPVFLLNTDFIWYRLIKEQEDFIYDPIISQMAKTKRYYQIPETSNNFKERLLEGFNNALSMLSTELKFFFESDFNDLGIRAIKKLEIKPKKVFIDFGGGRCEYQREYTNRLSTAIIDFASEVSIGSRFTPSNISFDARAKNDLHNLEESEIYVFSADEPEIDSGSAALAGYAYATGKEILMYYSGNIEILGDGNQKMRKNLMVECACTDVLFTFDTLIDRILKSLYGESVLC